MSKKITYASIVPLIGGMNVGMEKALGEGEVPQWVVSYDAFRANDQVMLDYYKKRGIPMPYYSLDADTNTFKEGEEVELPKVDVVTSLCPCAGLSQLNTSTSTDSGSARGADAVQNEWMYKSSRFILENVKPKVLWGENAPNLFTGAGKKVRENLYSIAREFGYSLSVIKTSTYYHGVPQNRSRTFYFFWQSEAAPIMNYYRKDFKSLKEYLREIPEDSPNQDYFYQNINIIEEYPPFEFLLEESGLSYPDYLEERGKFSTMDDIIKGEKYHDLLEWYEKKYPNGGNDRQERVMAKLARVYDKTVVRKAGGYWDSGPKFNKEYTNAIISKNASWFLHPEEPRSLNGRELIHMMGFPHDFEVKKEDVHKITQNVPACTAADWSQEVIKFCKGQLPYSDTDYLLQSNYTQKEITENDVRNIKSKVLF